MSTWNYVTIEAYCFADSEEPPCGKGGVSGFCLRGCPYFGHVDATPREAAIDVPLHSILWDRLYGRAATLYECLRWHLWDSWHYSDDWLNDIPFTQLWPETLVPPFWAADTEDKFRLWLHNMEKGEEIGKEAIPET